MFGAIFKKHFTPVLLILLAILPLLSAGGALAEENTPQAAAQTEHNAPLEGSIHNNQPFIPGANYRFSNRVNRTIPVPGGRIRPWTPVELNSENSCIVAPPAPELFELPEGVKIYYTANTICTSPVRAGPDCIFS